MRKFRVLAGGVVVSGCLFASGMIAGGAAAQTAEAVGGPMQLLQLTHPGKSESKSHTKLAAKHATKSSAKSAARSSSKTRIASRKKLLAHVIVAERKRHRLQSETQVAAAPASDNAWPAAPTAMAADAATLTPVQQTPPAPQIVAPVLGTPSELVVDGQTIRVASAEEANEIDLAANDAIAASDASRGPMIASKVAMTELTEPAAKPDSASAAMVQAATADASTTSWILQMLAALGGALAAGTVAWFLLGSAPQRIYVDSDVIASL
jgi:hypothetical protein